MYWKRDVGIRSIHRREREKREVVRKKRKSYREAASFIKGVTTRRRGLK